jgi:hypothetical protein
MLCPDFEVALRGQRREHPVGLLHRKRGLQRHPKILATQPLPFSSPL